VVTSFWNFSALPRQTVNFDAVIQPFVTRCLYTVSASMRLR